ncbi:MAG: FHA domain-containing protein [Myxococcales bacterium]|nr:FHA domain-containing protein [Myxococcales bacterium]
MLRFRLDDVDRIKIGRDQSNDIWIDHPAVRPHTALIYKREDQFCLKVYDGAKLLLNRVPVNGMHRLYSGDRIAIADREFIYARDDTQPEVSVGLTVLVEGIVQHAVVFRRSRIKVGRRDADVLLPDPSISDNHLVIECYSADGFFAFDLGSATGTLVNGVRVDERCRLHDNATLQVGHVMLRVSLLPPEAHGLLMAAPPSVEDMRNLRAAPPPMDRSPGRRLDPGAHSPRQRQADQRPQNGGFLRPLHQQNASAGMPAVQRTPPPPPLPLVGEPREAPPVMAPVPVTEVGSLRDILARARAPHLGGHVADMPSQDAVPKTRIVDMVSAEAVHQWSEQRYAPAAVPAEVAPAARPVARRSGEAPPAVRVKPEVYENAQPRDAGRSPPPPRDALDHAPLPERRPGEPPRPAARQDWSNQRENLHVRPREAPRDDMVAVSASPTGLHEQRTEEFDTAMGSAGARGKATWLQAAESPEEAARRQFAERVKNQPLTEALDTDAVRASMRADVQARYRISKGPADNAWVDDDRRRDRPPPVPPERRSESERRANPDWAAPQAPDPPPVPGAPRSHVDGSRRAAPVRVVDTSRRVPDGDESK